jgi:cytochrome c-type biogenesis protein CcmH/NrfG
MEGAARELRAAIRADAEYAEPCVNLANLAAGHGDLAEARKCFEAALRAEPGNASATEGLRKVKAALGK